jgi:hypothetical protein
MSYRSPADPADVIRDLAHITPMIYRGLEAGSDEARRWFKERGREPEPFHFASTVRCVTKEVLGSAGILAELEVEQLPNNGLSLVHRHYAIRIRKEAVGGGVPVPGPSRTLQGFYNQTLGFGDEYTEQINLLILWGVSAESVLRQPLALVCPRGPVTDTSSGMHWMEALHNPTYAVRVAPDESEADDLDITRPEEPTGSTD